MDDDDDDDDDGDDDDDDNDDDDEGSSTFNCKAALRLGIPFWDIDWCSIHLAVSVAQSQTRVAIILVSSDITTLSSEIIIN